MQEQYESIFPERIVYGTFGQRLGAYLLDILVLVVPISVITSIFGSQNNIFLEFIKHEDITSAAIESYFVQAIVNWLYFTLMESGKSQGTVGKQALGLKVTDLAGNRISFWKANARYFGKIVSAIIILIGFFMMLWDDKNQMLHDKMAGTLVAKKLSTI